MTSIEQYNQEIETNLANPNTLNSLIATVFKNFTPDMVKKAMLEGMMRKFTFNDFLEKNVYAIKYGNTYSLVTSVDYARKIGQKSGIIGKDAPQFTYFENGNIESCSVTVHKKVDGTTGPFTATVFFNEYYAGHKNPDGSIKRNQYGEIKPNLWDTKPHTMIAKVAEMHALRMACPEVMAQLYVEEEYQEPVKEVVDTPNYEQKLRSAKTLDDLKSIWVDLPAQARIDLEGVKDELKKSLSVEGQVVEKGDFSKEAQDEKNKELQASGDPDVIETEDGLINLKDLPF